MSTYLARPGIRIEPLPVSTLTVLSASELIETLPFVVICTPDSTIAVAEGVDTPTATSTGSLDVETLALVLALA